MEFFTIGNILTLGIVALVLFLYRQLDRHNNTVDKLQKFAAQVKEELGEFVAEKEGAVKDYGIALDVHQKAAKELLRRLQITDEELAHKAAAVAKIDERLSDYDVSLEELVRMTVRVQENLNRIQEESAFVEKVNKRVSESKEKLTALEKGLGEIERHFEQENADFLERVAQQLTLEVKSKIDDFQAEAEVIARHVEDNREAIERTEHIRSEQIRRDLDLINKTLDEAIEKAVARADNLEDSSLVKLREEAFQRVQQVHSAIDEKIKTYQESAKIQVTELQHLVTDQIDTWKNDTAEWEMQHRSHKDTWKKDIQEMNDRIEAQREAWELVVEDGNTKIQQFLTEMNAFSDESRERFTGETEMMEQRLKEVQHNTEALIGSLEQRIAFTVEETERKTLEATGERLEQWKKLTMETDANTRRMLADLETASGDIKTHFVAETAAMEERLKDLQAHTDKAIASLEDQVKKTATNIETTVLEDLGNRLEQGKQAAEERDSKAQQILSQMETSAVEFKTHFMTETAAMEEGLKNLQVQADEAILSLREQVAKVAADTEAEVLEDAGARLEQWKQAAEEGDAKSRTLLSELEASTAELKHYFVTETMGMEARLKELREHTDEAIAALRDQVVQAAEDTQTKVWTDTGTRLEQWKQTMEESDARSRQLLSDLETVSVETEKHISHEIAEATGRLDALQTKMDETVSHIEDEIANAGEKALVLADAELEKWKQAVAAEDTKVREIFADWETSLGETKEHISHELNAAIARVDALEVQIGETASRIEGDMTKAVTAAEEKALALADRELEKWRQTVETEDAKIRENLAALEASLGETKQQISHELNTAIGKVETLEAQIGETAAQIEGELTKAMSGASEKALALGDAELDKWRQTVETEDAKIRENLAALEISLGKTKQQVSDELNATTGKVEALETKIGETASRIEGEMTKALTAAEEKAAALAKGELEKWKQTVEGMDVRSQNLLSHLERVSVETEKRISDEVAGAAGQFEGIQAKIHEIASRIEEVMAQAVSSAEEKALTLTDRGLERWKAAAEEGDTRARQLLADLETVSAETKQRVFDEIAGAEKQLETLQDQINAMAFHITDEIAKGMQSAQEKASALAGEELKKWQSALEAEDTKTQDMLAHFKTASAESEKNLTDLEQRLTKISGEAEQKALAGVDTQFEKWKQAAEEADAQVRKILGDLETALGNTQKHISQELVAVEGQIEPLEKRINEAASLIDHEMALAVAQAKEKALIAAKEEDNKARALLADLETAFGNTKKQIFDDITSAQEQIGTIQKKIDEANGQIENAFVKAVSSAEERALVLADQGIEKWKQTVEAEDAKIHQVLGNLETASRESEKNIADLEQRLVKITGDMEQKVLEVTNERLEHWKLITSEAETNTRQVLVDLEAASAEIKTHFTAESVSLEQRLKDLQGYADEAMGNLKVQVEQIARKTEQQALEAIDTQLEKWTSLTGEEDAKVRQNLADLEASFVVTKKYITDEIAKVEAQLGTFQGGISETVSLIEQKMTEAINHAEEKALYMEQKVLEETDAKFEEYRMAQAEQFNRLGTLADDTAGMDAELRRHMAEIENRVREDFSLFEQHSATTRDRLTEEFAASVQGLKAELEGVKQELEDLKARAYQNVSEQLQVFEGDFSTNLAKKQDTLDQQFSEWQESLKVKLEGFMEESAALCRNTEQSFNEELQHTLGEQHEQFLSELEQLKAEISNFEEGIRSQMKGSNDGLDSFKAQLHHEMTGLLDTSRQELDKWQAGFNTELQGLDASMNEVCRRAQELIAESDERLKGLRSAMTDITKEAADHRAELFSQIEEQVKTVDASIKDADRHIKEFVTQTKLFERTDELKVELERRLEELRGDFDRIDQRRIEATDLEDQFVKIKRLEDEVNAKMTRFLSEKYRIEQMETEFNRLLQVSAAVEEKLTEVSNSDDTLQGIQIQIRKLNDALGDAEEKYQRIEKKNQTLDVTNDGIDRNFKSLQESEKMARYITDELNRLAGEQNTFRLALETLTAENTRARETADKLSLLDTSLSTIEERIEQMQKVRQWLARAETRLEELNKQSQDQIKLMGALMKDTGKTAVDDKGAPPIGVRENIVKLAQQGWNVDEISRAVKRSRGEVELILELMPKE
jgi:DNA repair exonuclease SbcCD ATPase subunit